MNPAAPRGTATMPPATSPAGPRVKEGPDVVRGVSSTVGRLSGQSMGLILRFACRPSVAGSRAWWVARPLLVVVGSMVR